MDADNISLAESFISKAYISQGSQQLSRHRKLIKTLLSQRKLPQDGWTDATIELLLSDAALMDSNNFLDHVGVGEREGRVVSNLVHRRHYGFAHGIGRSGDVAAEQPKAAGSSLLAAVTSFLVGDALKLAGLEGASSPIILPLATGMAITMSLLALRHVCPSTAKYILWPRIDQKTCFKSMYTAGFEAVVIPMKVQGDQLVTDLEYLKSKIIELGTAQIAGVITTTSCFAPRAFDNVVGVAAVCAEHNIHHVINNAYGVQSKTLCREITLAWRKGRVDIVIQSTDKNFMVPVGGAILVAPRHEDALLRGIQRLYPGRASASTMIDVVITLLHLGHSGWVRILQQREDVYAYAKSRLENFAQEAQCYSADAYLARELLPRTQQKRYMVGPLLAMVHIVMGIQQTI